MKCGQINRLWWKKLVHLRNVFVETASDRWHICRCWIYFPEPDSYVETLIYTQTCWSVFLNDRYCFSCMSRSVWSQFIRDFSLIDTDRRNVNQTLCKDWARLPYGQHMTSPDCNRTHCSLTKLFCGYMKHHYELWSQYKQRFGDKCFHVRRYANSC